MRRSIAALLSLGTGIMLVLSACGSTKAASPLPRPENFLTVALTNDGHISLSPQEFVTDQPALLLRLSIVNHGGDTPGTSPMNQKIVTLVSIARIDKTSSMNLDYVRIHYLDPGLYGGSADLLLPQGTYGFQIDGHTTGLAIKVLPKPGS